MLLLLSIGAALAAGGPAIAVADLDNHTGNATLDAAGAGTASILVTRLAAVPDLTVVERTQLQTVLSEIELSRGGAVDDASRVEAGRLIGADFMVLGALVSLEPGQLTVNLRVVDTSTAEVVRTESVIGTIRPDGTGLLAIVDQLADTVVDSLPGELAAPAAASPSSSGVSSVRLRELEALLRYGAVGAEDRSEPPSTSQQDLWRDRSRDMLSESQRRAYTVFTEGGAKVPNAREFARLVGDVERLSRFDSDASGRDARQDRRAGRSPIGWVYSPAQADEWIAKYNARSASETTGSGDETPDPP